MNVRGRMDIENNRSYKTLLNELKSILSKGQANAYKAVDNIKVQTYWQIGERIVREELDSKDRADYGKNLIDQLSLDLGIRRQRLYEIVKFFRCYSIVRTVSGQLSWNHYLELIKVKDLAERNYYQDQAINENWGVRELRQQIKNNLFENARDVGQMNKYINYFRNNKQYEHEKDTIGLIICSEAGYEEAQYALGGLEEKIFIATYKSKLPTIEQLKKAVMNVER